MIYVDHGATTKLHPKVLEEMMPYLTEEYGNPSSLHRKGRKAREAVDESRLKIASYFQVRMRNVYFTGCGTESDNLAIESAYALGKKQGKNHMITTSIEHPAVLSKCEELEKEGVRVTYLPPNEKGVIEGEDVKGAIEEDTFLISVMAINNEIGTIQRISEIKEIAQNYKIPLHVDAIQAIGHRKAEAFIGIDYLSLSPHKFNGPKGIGILITKEDIPLEPLIFGGGQERGYRGGTENVASIIGSAKALEIAQENLEEKNKEIQKLKEYFTEKIKNIPEIHWTISQESVAENSIHLRIEGIDRDVLLFQLDRRGICASGGSACSAGALEESHVLKSLGIHLENSASLRITLSHENTIEEMESIGEALKEIIERRKK